MTIQHHWEEKGLLIRYTGRTSGQELINSALELSGNARFDEIKYIIGDWSASEPGGITSEEVEALVACLRAIAQSNPRIINPSILPPEEHRQALVAFYVALTQDLPWNTDWFHTEEEARDWISHLEHSQ